MKRKKKRRTERDKAKEEMDDIFQMYIRYRDDYTCITCGKYIDPLTPLSKQLMHAGHFFDRHYMSVRWDEFNVNAQCCDCNYHEHMSKNKERYREALLRKIGQKNFDVLLYRKRTPFKIMTSEIRILAKEYKKKLEAEKNKNLNW